MMKNRRLFAIALCASMALSLMAGCKNSNSPASDTSLAATTTSGTVESSQSESTPDPVELTIWVNSRNQDEFVDDLEAEFLKEHPWITFNKVIKEGDPGNEFYQAVAAGTAPDYLVCSYTMMDKYMAAGIVAPLNEYLNKWDETEYLDQSYLDMITRNGNTYGVPNEVYPMLFAYNKALFAEAGIENPPATWEEALEYAKILNNPEKQVAGYATLTAEWTEWFFQYYVWQAGGDLTKQNADGTIKLTFTDPAVMKAAQYYQDLVTAKVLPSDRTLKFGDLLQQFSQGKIAMMPFATDWVKDVVNKGMTLEDLGLCLPPAGPSGQSATAISAGCYIVNAKSSQAKQDAAWEYISWRTSKNVRTMTYEYNASKGAIAPITIPRTDMSITDFTQFPAGYSEVLAAVGKIGRLEFYGKADFGSYVDRAVQKIISNPNADPAKEFGDAQALAEAESLSSFNEANKTE